METNVDFKENSEKFFKTESSEPHLETHEIHVNLNLEKIKTKEEYPDANPFWTGQDKRQVGIWLRVFRIKDIDIALQTITVRLVLIMKWLDHEFAKENSRPQEKDNRGFFHDTSNCRTTPLLRFENAKGNYETEFEFMWVNPQGVCHWERWGSITLTSPVDARNFPFDYQSFTIDLRLSRDFHMQYDRYFCTERSHQNEYNQNRIHICTYNNCIPEFNVCGFTNQDSFYVPRDDMHVTPLPVKSNLKSGWDASYTTLMVVKRNPNYYLLNIWLLTSLLTWLATIIFSLEADKLPEKQAYLVTLILVILGVRFSFASSLPKIPYISTLDYRICFSLAAQIALLVLISFSKTQQYTDIIWTVWLVLISFLEVFSIFLGYLRAILQRKELEKKAKFYFEEKDTPKKIEIKCINGSIPIQDKA
jgi:general stress protein CsbA